MKRALRTPTNGNHHARILGHELLDQDDREYALIPITIWNGTARVQTLNAKELMDFIEHGGDNIGFKLIALCLVDEDGRQVFRPQGAPPLDITDTDAMTDAVERVKRKNPKAINELAEALIALNEITTKPKDAKDQTDAVKNDSGETPTDVSPTDSPLN